MKRQQLLELVEFIGKTKNIYNEASLTEIIRMVSTNLFRALPPKQTNESASHVRPTALSSSLHVPCLSLGLLFGFGCA